ncbi:hypothetical protein BHE74_00008068 [Ensete ventricosum]|nr:hypothetical protein BHE74_00008068 [Ensete ventricosum]RZR89629.1 hypothetical protein BHM03_00017398 [Ensete ventricosum]
MPLLHVAFFMSTPFIQLGHFIKFHPNCFAVRFPLSWWWPSHSPFHGSTLYYIGPKCAFFWCCYEPLPHLILQCIHQCIILCEIMQRLLATRSVC